jgi:hypothetical protein
MSDCSYIQLYHTDHIFARQKCSKKKEPPRKVQVAAQLSPGQSGRKEHLKIPVELLQEGMDVEDIICRNGLPLVHACSLLAREIRGRLRFVFQLHQDDDMRHPPTPAALYI